MSRSYKKTPVIKYAGYGGFGKRKANKRVRRSELSVGKGTRYKRLYQTWNIHDVVSYWERERAKKRGMLKIWERLYHRK